MEPVKVVAGYLDGRRVKGLSQDFFPNKDRFHITPADKSKGEIMEILLKELKAIFFVRDFAGNKEYEERKGYLPAEKPSGRKVEVTFKDGEILIGTTLGYDPSRLGFFVFPSDPKSNNIRIFAITAAIKNVRFL
jgi:hypothetical protein